MTFFDSAQHINWYKFMGEKSQDVLRLVVTFMLFDTAIEYVGIWPKETVKNVGCN